jgi:hypothetical protein
MTDSYNEAPHPLQRRLLAEELLLRRLADDGRRFAASQRRGRIDPNPHQIDAVVFALRRIPYWFRSFPDSETVSISFGRNKIPRVRHRIDPA